MPSSPPRLCGKCRTVHHHRTSCKIQHLQGAMKDDRRLSSRPWARLTAQVKVEQEGICAREGCWELIDEIDHIIQRAVRPDLILDRDNVEGLCREHHRLKTRSERGG